MTTQEQLANANDFLMGAGSKSFQFEKMGDTCVGTVTEVEMRQQTDIETGEKLSWADGTPRMQLVITLQTDDRVDPDDDGLRVIFAKGGMYDIDKGEGQSMKNALAKAVRDGGGKGIFPGDKLAVSFTGLGVKKNKAYSAPKLYVAGYEKAVKGVTGPDLFGDAPPE